MPRLRRILIVNEDDSLLSKWITELKEKFHITSVHSIPDAEELIAETPAFAAIVIEPFEDGNTFHAIAFIQKLRRTYHKPIIAIAAKHEQQQQMLLAGCSAYTTRYNVPKKLFEVFNGNSSPNQYRVLIVSNDESLLNQWKTELGESFYVMHAPSILHAEKIMAEKPRFDTIAVAPFEDGKTLQAISFIERIRRGFHKPIIAIALKHLHQQQMVLAGCTVYTTRQNVPNKICEVLNIIDITSGPKKRTRVKRSWKKAHREEFIQTVLEQP
ncbi:MAG: hypothetical protein NTX72_02865 [Candidatus Uhrbacteria bacterium]|nr:hypothetical protein [Candidatus Uhrbacteria bacterium]